ncbi:MAG: family 78 glycoside hydrolase catalytic domain [Prolixibacteraceae bacterium]
MRQFLLISAILFSVCGSVFSQSALCKPDDLRCEYLVNPLGVDVPHPRFCWKLDDGRYEAVQTAWKIVVGTDSAAVASGVGNFWDSGKVESDNILAGYAGKELLPFTRYFWGLSVWDKDGGLSGPAIASFETGMMNMKNWQGAWISDGNDVDLKPAPYFRKVFETTKKIKAARAYIAVAGLYELYINGQRIGDHRLDPMYTRFDRRTLYVTYDVTRQIRDGENALGVLLGNGWYNHQSTAVWDFHKAPWRARPAFCLDLRVTYEDGSVETVTSGRDWKTSLSPVIFNSIYTAEHYDARLEQEDWDEPGFDDSKWKNAIYRAAPSTNIVSQLLHPIRDVELIRAKSMNQLNDTTWVFDLGRNISGVSSIVANGPAGTVLRLKHGERLKECGRVDLSNIDVHYRPTDNTDPFQTDLFILSGRGEESFKPRFNYKGFQYVEVVASNPISLTRESLTGYFMHSNLPAAGEISTSNPVIDKIWRATNASYLSNLFGYPTDCPQREKNGWTGDAHIAIETGLYSFDGITVYEKWLADHLDEQQPNGVLPAIIPTAGWGYHWANGPDWTSTIALIPWNVYLFYGDSTLLLRCYDGIKKYVDHINRISPAGLTTWGLGDWVPVKSKSQVELTSTAYYYTDVKILSQAARMFGRGEDYKKYAALAEKIKKAFNEKFLNRETASYASGIQTELSVPLYWDLVPADMKEKVAANLAKRVEADLFHLDVGLLGQKAILNALSENGHAGAAWKIASQETFPSWGWWIVRGATTLYENWDPDAERDISMNHIMFGEIGAWLYKGMGGIKPDPLAPGFKNTILCPSFFTGLERASASHESPYGRIVSEWDRDKRALTYRAVIPANSSATLYLPEGIVLQKVILTGGSGAVDLQKRSDGGYFLPAGGYEMRLKQERK